MSYTTSCLLASSHPPDEQECNLLFLVSSFVLLLYWLVFRILTEPAFSSNVERKTVETKAKDKTFNLIFIKDVQTFYSLLVF